MVCNAHKLFPLLMRQCGRLLLLLFLFLLLLLFLLGSQALNNASYLVGWLWEAS